MEGCGWGIKGIWTRRGFKPGFQTPIAEARDLKGLRGSTLKGGYCYEPCDNPHSSAILMRNLFRPAPLVSEKTCIVQVNRCLTTMDFTIDAIVCFRTSSAGRYLDYCGTVMVSTHLSALLLSFCIRHHYTLIDFLTT